MNIELRVRNEEKPKKKERKVGGERREYAEREKNAVTNGDMVIEEKMKSEKCKGESS